MTRISHTVPVPRPGDGARILLNGDGTLTYSFDPPDRRLALDSKPAWASPRGRDENDERDGDLSGWEREAVELHELLAELLTPDDLHEVEGRLHRLLLNGDEANAMGGPESGMPVGRPSGRDAGPAAFRGMPRTGARDATYSPTVTSSPGTQAADAALRRAKRLKAEADSYYARWPEAKRIRVLG